MRTPWLALAGATIIGSAPGATAQSVTRVDIDNDSFNFWQAPRVRADREYSQGFRLNVLRPTDTPLARRLLGGPNQCADGATTRDCRLLSFAINQAIYTPTLDVRRRAAGERPYAGWLGAEVGVQRERDRALTAFSLALGVTGTPSMAEAAQKAVHRIFGFPTPEGWDAQLPSELAVVATYTGAVDALRLHDAASGFGVHVAPQWTVRAGTMATDASAGVQLTVGIRPPMPWASSTSGRADRWGVYLRAGAAQSVIGRNLFLDGSTFSTSVRVERNRWVNRTNAGIGARTPVGLIEWQMHSGSREYRSQPTPHAYSTFSFILR